MREIYYEFAQTMKDKLINEVNGRIEYEIYAKVDTVIFKISFKDFSFSYAINQIQDIIYSGQSYDELVEELKKKYMRTIQNAFFKSEYKKSKLEAKKLARCYDD